MQSIAVHELVSKGFTEDPEGLKEMQRSFALPLIIGAGGFVVSFGLMMLEKIRVWLGVSLAAASWCFTVLTLIGMYRSRPRSWHTGKPMLKYKNRSPAAGVIHEILYVCPDSKTFARRVYLENED